MASAISSSGHTALTEAVEVEAPGAHVVDDDGEVALGQGVAVERAHDRAARHQRVHVERRPVAPGWQAHQRRRAAGGGEGDGGVDRRRRAAALDDHVERAPEAVDTSAEANAVAPKRSATARRSGARSTAVTVAPASRAAWMALAPMPPIPITATRSPAVTVRTDIAADACIDGGAGREQRSRQGGPVVVP